MHAHVPSSRPSAGAEHRHGDEFLGRLEVVNGAVDELGAVVGFDHFDAFWEGWSCLAVTANTYRRL